MNITNAKYYRLPSTDENICINATIDGVVCGVPLDPDNRHYAEILRLVHTGQLTIKEAD